MSILFWLAPLFFITPDHSATVGIIQLTLQNIEREQGTIRLAVYNNKADFEAQSNEVYGKEISNFSGKEKYTELPDLAHGQYAIAVYHDLNNNQKLDKNLMGIPTEPYAFSNNPKVKWSPPTFEESKFQLQGKHLKMQIHLQFWSAY